MTNLKTKEEKDRFYQIFDEKLEVYKTLLDKVKNKLFVNEHHEIAYMNLSGEILEQVRNITQELYYQTVFQYKESEEFFEKDFFND